MNDNATLGAIRRRWWIIVLFAVLGAIVGAIPEPAQVEEEERTFTATHTLLLNEIDREAGVSVVPPNQVTLFVSTGEVPARAAATLGFAGNPASLASQVSPFLDSDTGALTISSTGADADRVVIVADTFADELTSYLAERQDVIYQERLAASIDRLASIEQELITVTRDLARSPEDPVLIAQQSAISRRYSVAFEQSETLESRPPVIGFTTLERAQAVEVTQRGLERAAIVDEPALLGGIVGAALGFGIAVLLGMLDRRIRTREQAEEILDMRARVLIPKVRDKQRDQLVVRSDRHDALSDSYRTVRNVVAFANGSEPRERAPITLVVSPSPGDGKTSLAANLAAASAETGQRTVLVNADFRRPRLSTVFAPHADEPLPFLLEDIDNLSAATVLNRSGIDRLRILDLTGVPGSAGELVRASANKLDDMARAADAVIIDSSPVGATAEVLDLVPYADAIVIVVRIGHTTRAQAQRAIGILRDLTNVPILLVLGGLKNERTHYYEYESRTKKVRSKRRWWLFWRRQTPKVVESVPDDGAESELDDAVEAAPEPRRNWRHLWRRQSVGSDGSQPGDDQETEPADAVEATLQRDDDAEGDDEDLAESEQDLDDDDDEDLAESESERDDDDEEEEEEEDLAESKRDDDDEEEEEEEEEEEDLAESKRDDDDDDDESERDFDEPEDEAAAELESERVE